MVDSSGKKEEAGRRRTAYMQRTNGRVYSECWSRTRVLACKALSAFAAHSAQAAASTANTPRRLPSFSQSRPVRC